MVAAPRRGHVLKREPSACGPGLSGSGIFADDATRAGEATGAGPNPRQPAPLDEHPLNILSDGRGRGPPGGWTRREGPSLGLRGHRPGTAWSRPVASTAGRTSLWFRLPCVALGYGSPGGATRLPAQDGSGGLLRVPGHPWSWGCSQQHEGAAGGSPGKWGAMPTARRGGRGERAGPRPERVRGQRMQAGTSRAGPWAGAPPVVLGSGADTPPSGSGPHGHSGPSRPH